MPTTDAPKMQAPMEAANPARLQTGEPGSHAVVTKQPVSDHLCLRTLESVENRKLTRAPQTSEPRPSMDNEMTLRGGRFNLGCSCCDGRCHFRLC